MLTKFEDVIEQNRKRSEAIQKKGEAKMIAHLKRALFFGMISVVLITASITMLVIEFFT